MDPQTMPPDPPHQYERDPFPRMIVVCILISMSLLLVIAMLLVAGYVARMQERVENPVLVPRPETAQD